MSDAPEQREPTVGPSPLTQRVQSGLSPQARYIPGASKNPPPPRQWVEPRPVSPTLSPSIVAAGVADEDMLPIESRARRDLETVQGHWQQFESFRAAALNDTSLTKDAADVSIYDGQSKTADAGIKVLGALGNELEKAVRNAESALTQAAAPVHRGKFDEEIREHVERLNAEGRVAFLNARAAAGDTDAIAAVLEAPWYLSGVDGVVSDEVATNLRATALRKRAPEAAAQLDRVKVLHAAVLRAVGANIGLAPKPDPRIEGLRRRAQAREATAMRLPK